MLLQRSRQYYTDCNLKPTELLDCVLIGVCAVIRLNIVSGDSVTYPRSQLISAAVWSTVTHYESNIPRCNRNIHILVAFTAPTYLE